MQYELSQLAPGSYDILLRGVVVASLVRSSQAQNETWTAELLEEQLPGQRPAPFTQPEHSFSSFEEACKWLEDAETRSSSEVQAWRR